MKRVNIFFWSVLESKNRSGAGWGLNSILLGIVGVCLLDNKIIEHNLIYNKIPTPSLTYLTKISSSTEVKFVVAHNYEHI